MKKSEKVELNLNIEIGRVVLLKTFTSREKTFCSIPRWGKQDRIHAITPTYPVPDGKMYI